MTQVLDELSAWAELERFAAVADIELDERARPDDPEAEVAPEAEPADEDEESEVADYSDLIAGLQSGQLKVSSTGSLELHWRKSPRKNWPVMTFDPETWKYTRAIRALAMKPQVPPVSAAARARAVKLPESEQISKLDRALEILAGEPADTLIEVNNRKDRALLNVVGTLIFTG